MQDLLLKPRRSSTMSSEFMYAIARIKGVDENLIRLVVNKDIHYFSYKLGKGQFLSKVIHKRWLKRTKMLIKLKYSPEPGMLWVFSDEKNCPGQKINSRNKRLFVVSPKDVSRVMQMKFPATIMVFSIISSEDVMATHFFPDGLSLNTDSCICILKEVMKPWIDWGAAMRSYVWHKTQSLDIPAGRHGSDYWKTSITPADIWSPNSPECNPFNVFE